MGGRGKYLYLCKISKILIKCLCMHMHNMHNEFAETSRLLDDKMFINKLQKEVP